MLDEELTIVFLNRAAQEWLGVEESLVGRRCAYHSGPQAAGLDAVAAGLCPPPQVLSGRSATAIVSRVAEDGRRIERKAKFLPIGFDAESVLGIIAILDMADQPTTSVGDECCEASTTVEPTSSDLHEHIRRFREEAAVRYRADRLIGQGPAMRLARRQVELAAACHDSVLVVGPTGSGREHLAAAIHYGEQQVDASHAVLRTLAPLDCSLLAGDLVEAVRAAIAREKLLSDSSATGTLLFHRIDELSIEVQAELAGLLIRKPVSWRLIATATQPLIELARRGAFREDLAMALSTIVVELPSLAQRRDDLPLLAQLFLEERNAAGARQIGGFTPAALDLLDGHAWPNNLDELAQVVAESHQRAGGREIDVADLPDRIRLVAQASVHARRPEETIAVDEYLGRVERELIRRALARAKGNKAKAARLLGLTRPRLYRRMVQLGLEP